MANVEHATDAKYTVADAGYDPNRAGLTSTRSNDVYNVQRLHKE